MLLTREHVGIVYHEDVKRHEGTYAGHAFGAFRMVMLEVLEDVGVDFAPIGVSAVKGTATGKGNAKKSAMVSAAKERWGLSVVTEDESDALWIAETGRLSMLEGVL